MTSQRGMIVRYHWLIFDYYYNFDITHHGVLDFSKTSENHQMTQQN